MAITGLLERINLQDRRVAYEIRDQDGLLLVRSGCKEIPLTEHSTHAKVVGELWMRPELASRASVGRVLVLAPNASACHGWAD